MEHPTWIGKTLGNRYRIDKLLGQGGMSAVYKAMDPNLKRVVAIKLIHEHLSTDPSFVQRFEDEAAAVASLRHPNIVQVFDFNHDDDVYYMALEFIAGETLQDRMKLLAESGGQLSLEDALKFGVNIADAVDYSHQHGMVHRDIKPANIMLDTRGQAILMDFGIVKILGGESHTSTGAVVGTARYMPPEIIRGEAADYRSDIYSLGITLYEALSGRPPFVADSAMTLMMMHLNNPVPDVRDFRSGIQPEVVAVLEKCLAKNREDRYQTAAELSADLRSVLMEAPTSQSVPRKIESASPSPREISAGATASIGAAPETAQSPASPGNILVQIKALPKGILIGIAAVLLIIVLAIGRGANGGGQVVPTPSLETINAPALKIDIVPTATRTPKPAATQTPTAIPTKSFPARIAYVIGLPENNGAVYVADATGSNSKDLTGNDCINAEPNWAPDGKSLIYQSNCMGSYDIWRMNGNGRGKQVLLSEGTFDEREARYSPSGAALAYVRHIKGESYNTNGDIRIFEFGGSDASTGLQGRGPVYSPDGSHIAYMSFVGNLWQIFVYDVLAREDTQITFDDNDCRWPAWSPDGKYIVYNSATGGGTTPTGIWIISADGDDPISIASGNNGRPSWSDTGWIIFNSRDGLWMVHPDGSDLHQVTEDNGWAGTWSR